MYILDYNRLHMKIIIAGSRRIKHRPIIFGSIKESLFDITTVLSGGGDGVDRIGEQWAFEHGIPIERHEAKWNEHGRSAEPIRNREMAAQADGGIVIWTGDSPGSKDIINALTERNLPVFEVLIDPRHPTFGPEDRRRLS